MIKDKTMKKEYKYMEKEQEKEQKKILLAEDDVFVSDVYRTRLKSEGYNVDVVGDGREVLTHLEKSVPDIILLDIMMPYMDGMEVLSVIKSREDLKSVPILMLTNNSEKENVQKALSLGVEGYIIKSHFTPSEIVTKVNMLFDKQV